MQYNITLQTPNTFPSSFEIKVNNAVPLTAYLSSNVNASLF